VRLLVYISRIETNLHFLEKKIMEESDEMSIFVQILLKNTIIFSKSQIPLAKDKKAKALKSLCDEYSTSTGKPIDIKQALKKINNLKTRVKLKSDMNRTGNRPIKMLPWEVQLLDGMKVEENPVFSRVKGRLYCCILRFL
jgi:hypothetical protein